MRSMEISRDDVNEFVKRYQQFGIGCLKIKWTADIIIISSSNAITVAPGYGPIVIGTVQTENNKDGPCIREFTT